MGVPANSLAAKLAALCPKDGKSETAVENLFLFRTSHCTPLAPVVYTPKLFIIGQGSKELYVGNEAIHFDAFQFLLLTVPLPIRGRVDQASSKEPFLALNVNLELSVVADLMQQMERLTGSNKVETDNKLTMGMQIHTLDQALLDVVQRLLDTLDNPERANILGTMAIREIYYHLLTRKEGDLLRAFVHQDRNNVRIAKVLDYIQHHLHQPLNVDQLAEQANMSPSSFHQHFKSVTENTPQQYIKSMRLDEARRRLVEERMTVSEVAYQVGYSSLSQFSREFKRLFGVSPREAIAPAGGFTDL